jgi:hypothetical protein
MSSIARQKLHLLVSVFLGICLGLAFSVADISIGLTLTLSVSSSMCLIVALGLCIG